MNGKSITVWIKFLALVAGSAMVIACSAAPAEEKETPVTRPTDGELAPARWQHEHEEPPGRIGTPRDWCIDSCVITMPDCPAGDAACEGAAMAYYYACVATCPAH